jgi:hypothetical protein
LPNVARSSKVIQYHHESIDRTLSRPRGFGQAQRGDNPQVSSSYDFIPPINAAKTPQADQQPIGPNHPRPNLEQNLTSFYQKTREIQSTHIARALSKRKSRKPLYKQMEDEFIQKDQKETSEIRQQALVKIKKEHKPIRMKDIREHQDKLK